LTNQFLETSKTGLLVYLVFTKIEPFFNACRCSRHYFEFDDDLSRKNKSMSSSSTRIYRMDLGCTGRPLSSHLADWISIGLISRFRLARSDSTYRTAQLDGQRKGQESVEPNKALFVFIGVNFFIILILIWIGWIPAPNSWLD
jgi:hypothetical protein